jgi:hypothetical protein
MYWTRNVIIPDDAKVYVENNKFKADKIILDDRQLIDWINECFCKWSVDNHDCRSIIKKYLHSNKN